MIKIAVLLYIVQLQFRQWGEAAMSFDFENNKNVFYNCLLHI